jgi:Zn-dependent peptidase ImmA (M78 family)
MNKAVINPNRLQWCLDNFDLSIKALADKLKISIKTLEAVWKNEPSLTIKQLKRISEYFNRSMLFFINPDKIEEDRILSPQFRTINNRRPIHSRKLRIIIEQVEKHRKIYLGLLEDLGENIISNWSPTEVAISNKNEKEISLKIRRWLALEENINFKDLRQDIEDKGIMVIVSNGFNGPWQIDKKEPVRGFSLYFDVLPVIVIKKQSEGAQAFTLFHELVHLLLHKNSVLDYEEDYHSNVGIEKEANKIAGNILIPDEFIEQIDVDQLIKMEANNVDSFLEEFSFKWCVSNEAILVRLLQEKRINNTFYTSYRGFRTFLHKQKEEELESSPEVNIPRKYRHREPLNVFGKPFVGAVLDAYHNQHITLAKASTYLDNIKVKDVHKLVDYVVQL